MNRGREEARNRYDHLLRNKEANLMTEFTFKPGTNKFKATAKADLFIASGTSSKITENDRIINFGRNDRIDLPGDWANRNGKPTRIRRLYANLNFTDQNFRLDNLDVSAVVEKRGQAGYLGLLAFDIILSGSRRTKGVAINWADYQDSMNSTLIFLPDYNGPVAVI
jgi:hypothetical protein